MRKAWSKEEDEILCRLCIDLYVNNKSIEPIESLISQCAERPEFDGRIIGSIRMRIQNIKAVLEMHKISNSIPVAPLENFAEQTELILLKMLQEDNSEI